MKAERFILGDRAMTMSQDACRTIMSRYDELLQISEALWQKERATRVPIEEGPI